MAGLRQNGQVAGEELERLRLDKGNLAGQKPSLREGGSRNRCGAGRNTHKFKVKGRGGGEEKEERL